MKVQPGDSVRITVGEHAGMEGKISERNGRMWVTWDNEGRTAVSDQEWMDTWKAVEIIDNTIEV